MKLFRFIILLTLCLSLCACSSYKKSTSEILDRMLSEFSDIPKGTIYYKNATEDQEGYLSPFLAEALYGTSAEECFTLMEDYSIYLSSFATPYEIAVFRCYSATDAVRLEQLCRERADIVSVALRYTDFYKLCQSIRIVREGDTVVFAMTDDPSRAERLIKKRI